MISLKHKFTSAIPDAGDPTIVQPSNWNDEHALTQATATILGRVSALTGPTEELTPAQARTLLNVADGATANSSDAFLLARANHTGTESADVLTDGTTNKAFLATERTKLAGIATGATANSTDAFLLARANHTGTQSADTLTDGTTNKAFLATERTKLAGIATGADVTATALNTTAKGSPVDADRVYGGDSAASFGVVYATWTQIKAFLKTYFDTLYQPLAAALTSWAGVTRAAGFDTFAATPSSANLRALLSDEVGTGAAYFVGGALGTPASGTATNLTGLPLTTGVTGTLGIGNGGTGQTTAAAAFDALAPTTTRGDIIYRGASGNLRLAAGTSGYALIAAGAGADPAWTGFLQSGTGAATRTWNSKAAETLTPYDFGAVGDGVADDTTALNNWFTRVAVVGAGELGFGTFRATANITWSCPRNCPKIVGNGSSYSKIAFDNGFGLTIQGVSGANPVFYGRFADFSIVGNIAGVLVKVANGASDAFNGVPFDNIVVNNNSTNALNKGGQFNAIYSSKVFMTVNCSGATNGTAIEITGGSMNTIKAICGNASVGLHLTSTGLAVAGNLFDAVDIEVCSTCVLIDSANVQDNTFVGGVIAFNAVGSVGIDATAGSANEFRNMNYGGSGTLFHATVATHRKGFNWVNRVQNLVSTPAVPASTTAITNTNGQAALVNISGGTVSAIIVNGVTIAVTTPATVFVSNDETISITYTVAPTWRWMPANF